MVTHTDQRSILVAKFFDLLRRLGDPPIVGPVEVRTMVAMRVEGLVVCLRVEGFMGIKGLDLQKPAILVAIDAYKFQSSCEDLSLRHIFFPLEIRSVDPVLAPEFASLFPQAEWYLRIGHMTLPRIALLTANDFPRPVAGMVSGSTIFPVVSMIADQVGVDAMLGKNLRHRLIEWLQRSPATVEKIVAPGMQLAACGDTGHTADIGIIEGDRSLC